MIFLLHKPWNHFCFLLEPSFDFAAVGEDGCLVAMAVPAMLFLLEPLKIFAGTVF